jgi:tetratricopeptide (TPR) repeat protein
LLDTKQDTNSFKTRMTFDPWHLRAMTLAASMKFWKRRKKVDRARIYSERAVEAWEKMKDNIESLHSIEEAWLYEEVGYIYEKVGELKTAMEYYKKAESKYEQAYTEDIDSTEANHIDGDWDDYWGFFVHQITDFRLIYFYLDGTEENDYSPNHPFMGKMENIKELNTRRQKSSNLRVGLH